MKILFLNDFIPPRNNFGPGKRDFDLAREFKRRGHDVYFITSCQDRKFEGEEDIDGIKIFNIYSKYHYRFKFYVGVYNFFTLRKVKRILKEIRPDIVYADIVQFHISYASLKIAKKYAKAVFFTARDFTLFSQGKFLQKEKECGGINYKVRWFDNFKKAKLRFNPLFYFFVRQYLKCANKVFAVSDEMEKALNQNSIGNTRVVYNGMSIFTSSTSITESDFKNIFLLGRINESKGIYVLLDSLPIIFSKIPEARLIIAGVKDDERIKIEKYIEDKNIKKEKIKMFEYLIGNELVSIFKSSVVIVSPSIYPDPFPGVNLEAALYGKPVVTTCFGGAKEFIIDGKTGYVVNPYDENELAGKIIDLLMNKKKAEDFGKANFERLKNEFSIEKQANILLDWYKKYAG